LISGATGFVGQPLVAALRAQQCSVGRALRQAIADDEPGDVVVGDIGPDTDWLAALRDADCVVHLAARTHVLDERSADALEAYRRINVLGTIRLAQLAAAAGVRRLVFLSSVKVNGDATTSRAYTENDAPMPQDAYGITKREAEDALRRIGSETRMEVVILRPPLVYGPGVKGNFLRLLRLIERGLPLPLASVDNRRSLIYVENLVNAIIACVNAPAAAGKTYLVSDGEDVSTPALIGKLATAMGRSPRLLPCPVALLNLGAAMVGKRAAAARLTGSLRVDSSRIRAELGWVPRYSLDQGLNATAQWYHQRQN